MVTSLTAPMLYSRPQKQLPVAPKIGFGAARKGTSSPYTSDNTITPPALYHTLVSNDAVKRHSEMNETLSQYARNDGTQPSISWVKNRQVLGQVPMTVFDFETTGTAKQDRIIQIAATPLKRDFSIAEERGFYSLLHPGMVATEDGNRVMFPINAGASKVHGIYADNLKDKPQIEEVLPGLRQQYGVLTDRNLLVAYNAKFDVGMLNETIARWNRSANRKDKGFLKPLNLALVVDPFVLIQRIHPYVSIKKKLENHYRLLMGCELENKHDAQADVEATVDVLKYVSKYLQKHSIPVEWAQLAERFLKKQNASAWEALPDREKTARIAGLIRRDRALFEAKFGVSAEPVQILDMLRYQHGGIPLHEQADKPYYPTLDIVNLNHLGVDGEKQWDGTDTLDSEIADEVRWERHEENTQMLKDRFVTIFPRDIVHQLTANLIPPINDNAATKAARWSSVMTESLGLVFAKHYMEKTLPNTTRWTTAQRSAVREDLKELLLTKLRVKTFNDAALDFLVDQGIRQVPKWRESLGNRYIYRHLPVTGNLIDMEVLQSVAQANKTRAERGSRTRFGMATPRQAADAGNVQGSKLLAVI
jgi:DNA polymerase III epsilon subunit-like protein